MSENGRNVNRGDRPVGDALALVPTIESFGFSMRWSIVTVVRAAILAAFLVVQFAVPAALLFGRRPARFGWQMFAAHTLAPAIAAVRDDGTSLPVRVDDYFAFRRGDIDPAAFERLPEHICRVEPTFQALAVRFAPGAPVQTYACR